MSLREITSDGGQSDERTWTCSTFSIKRVGRSAMVVELQHARSETVQLPITVLGKRSVLDTPGFRRLRPNVGSGTFLISFYGGWKLASKGYREPVKWISMH
jgi:hypothetical protein